MILHNAEVARRFSEILGFGLFFFSDLFWKKYVWYKMCSSDFALYNKKKFDWFRSWQDSLTEFNIFPKTFAPYIS